MKKILIPIGIFFMMSCTQTNEDTYIEAQKMLFESLDVVQDMKEWMQEDITQGAIDEDYGKYYLESLTEVEEYLIDYTESSEMSYTVEELQEEIDSYYN